MAEGYEGFVWFKGIVENINDPLKLGRVYVRNLVEQTLTSQNDYTDPNDIHWAEVLMPPTGPNRFGVGVSPLGMERGTFVLCFYMDPKNKKQPVVFGTLASYDEEEGASSHSVSAQARGEWKDTKTYYPKVEPKSAYRAQYPYNKTITTKSGHVLELDDTPTFERIHIYHRSGSYIEIRPDGTIVSKSVNNVIDVSGEGRTIIAGNGNITILADNGELNLRGNADIRLSSANGAIRIEAPVIGLNA